MRYLCLLIGEPGIDGPVPGRAASGASAPASGPATASPGEVADTLYAGKKAPLRPLHDQLMAMVHAMGPDVSLAPKKGYVSLRRPGKQFAMIQPSGAGRIDLGLILPGVPQAGRLEPSGSFNALFTHRVRVTSAGDLPDDALAGWLAAAYAAAGCTRHPGATGRGSAVTVTGAGTRRRVLRPGAGRRSGAGIRRSRGR